MGKIVSQTEIKSDGDVSMSSGDRSHTISPTSSLIKFKDLICMKANGELLALSFFGTMSTIPVRNELY
ncbi:hypothetical protein RJ639_015232 [Escallonia herrerae]|uniref:Uncharacterized protein n=1 Tax=Escallonia herrerae TaxID=1293975 RepID=A0AA89APK7_9ASTE|nr:hypothetical protein RJ639_015232 [Escallonia herrerae]